MNRNQPVSGLDLKVERTRRRVKANVLAVAMGVSPSRIAAIEVTQFPSDQLVARYVAALDTCAASTTSEVA